MNNIYKTDVWIDTNGRQSIWFAGDEYNWIPKRIETHSKLKNYMTHNLSQYFNPLFF